MSYRQRWKFLWQVIMGSWGKLVVSLCDLIVTLAWVGSWLVLGWNVWGVLGVVVGGMVGVWSSFLARAIVMVVSQAVVSVCVVIPIAGVLAIWTQIPSDAVAPPLE